MSIVHNMQWRYSSLDISVYQRSKDETTHSIFHSIRGTW